MNKIVCSLLTVFALAAPIQGNARGGDVYVHGYFRGNGTYVQPHYRSAPDSTPYNNWSAYGNTNPYTGKAGTKHYYGSVPSTSPRRDHVTTEEFNRALKKLIFGTRN